MLGEVECIRVLALVAVNGAPFDMTAKTIVARIMEMSTPATQVLIHMTTTLTTRLPSAHVVPYRGGRVA